MSPAPDESKPDSSPFAGLDYPEVCSGGDYIRSRPATADAVGRLGVSIRELTGVGGLDALAAAILVDQGRCREALDLLAAVAADRAAEAEERKRRAQEKAAGR